MTLSFFPVFLYSVLSLFKYNGCVVFGGVRGDQAGLTSCVFIR